MDKTAFKIYLIALVLGLLLFGAVHTYAYTIISLGVFSGSLLLVIENIKRDPKRGGYQFQFPKTSLNFAFFFLFVLLFFQVIPLPNSPLGFLSPEARVAEQKSLPALRALISEDLIREWFFLSPYYYPVLVSIIGWSVYVFFPGLTGGDCAGVYSTIIRLGGEEVGRAGRFCTGLHLRGFSCHYDKVEY